MNPFTKLLGRVRRAWTIVGAFTWSSWVEARAYPIGILTSLVGIVIAPVVLYFVGQLVPSQPSVGGDYFTFAAIGTVATTAMSGGLAAFSGQLDLMLSTGRLESLLVEPIRWRVLPFALAGWPVSFCLFTLVTQFVIIIALGAVINASALPLTAVLLLGGIASGHAVGVLSGSLKILSKRSDPLITLYTLAVGLLSGAVFPVDLLPAPLQVLSYLLPQTYVLAAVRKILMPDGDAIQGPSAGLAVLLLLAFLAVVYPVSLWLFGRALEYARKIGTLAGY